MLFGLWRYKWQKWLVRPLYHYYAPLVAALRPGVTCGLSARPAGCMPSSATAGRRARPLLNSGSRAVTVCLPWQGPGERRRVRPGRLPAGPTCRGTKRSQRIRRGRLALRLAAQG